MLSAVYYLTAISAKDKGNLKSPAALLHLYVFVICTYCVAVNKQMFGFFKCKFLFHLIFDCCFI